MNRTVKRLSKIPWTRIPSQSSNVPCNETFFSGLLLVNGNLAVHGWVKNQPSEWIQHWWSLMTAIAFGTLVRIGVVVNSALIASLKNMAGSPAAPWWLSPVSSCWSRPAPRRSQGQRQLLRSFRARQAADAWATGARGRGAWLRMVGCAKLLTGCAARISELGWLEVN